jgi:predicted ATPase
MINHRFVITGGPGAGKTTTLEALALRGFRYVPDSARAIIRERLESGLSPRPPLDQFSAQVLKRDIAGYRETPVQDDPVFFDRGVWDAVAFFHSQGGLSLEQAQTYLHEFRYNPLVFIMPPWEEIYTTDSERDQIYAEAVAVFESSKTWYAQGHYDVVEVPRASVDERVNFILKAVEAALAAEVS